MTQLDFDGLLEALGHDGFVAVCNRPVGGQFRSHVVSYKTASSVLPATGDCWYSVNPLTDPATWPEEQGGRGTATQVTRLAAVFADLDIKAGGMASYQDAQDVISDLSDMVGTRPTAIVISGGGLQPLWMIEDGPSGADARALLRRWGRMVVHVAGLRGGQADMVYDLARVLRVPGTMNHKYDPPATVVGVLDAGRPLSADELDDALTLYGAVEMPGDREEAGSAVVSPPADWDWADRTCNYALSMVEHWYTDEPAARHPWLVRQTTRIAAAHRYGCWDEAGYQAACRALTMHFQTLLGRGAEARSEAPGEIADAFAWGRDLAGSKTDEQIASELGSHSHEPPGAPLSFTGKPLEMSTSEVPEDPHEATRRLFPRLDWNALWEDETEEEWILEPLVAYRRGVALFSPPKVGKSLLALEVAVGISNGSRTLGAMPDRPHRLLYIDHENDPLSDVRTRLQDMGYTPGDLGNLFYLSYPRMSPLDTTAGAQEIVAAAQAYDCDIVIIDTISRAVAGEENENDTWLRLYRLTGLALKQAGVAVMRLDHTGKDQDKGMRGGSAKYGDLDAVWKLTKEAEMTYKLTLTDKRFRVSEEELVLTREENPLRHKVEGGGWMVAADRRFNELLDNLVGLNVPQSAGREVARAALRTASISVSNSELANAIRHRKTCPNWSRTGVDHRTCPRGLRTVSDSEEESWETRWSGA